MIAPRRIIVSLTPLLDLLLIVIFAQYMDLKGTSEKAVARVQSSTLAEVQRERRLRQKAEQQRDYAVTLRKETERQLEAQTETIEGLREETDQLRSELQEVTQNAQVRAEQARRDLKEAAGVLSDIFKLPEEAFQPALASLPVEERTAVRRELEDVRGQGVDKVIQHLRKISALKKRCDFWEVYIAGDDTITVKNGQYRFGPFSAESQDQFIVEMKQISSQMPEPKSLVIVLVSYGAAQRVTRRNVEQGLRDLCDLYLKAKYDGEKRFEVAMLGYTQAPP